MFADVYTHTCVWVGVVFVVGWIYASLSTPGNTDEVASLHTLRLVSLKVVFQPLHTFLVNKL